MNALSFIFLAIFGTSEGKRSSISAMVSQRLGLPKTKMRVLIFALYHVLQIKEQILNLQILKKIKKFPLCFHQLQTDFCLRIRIDQKVLMSGRPLPIFGRQGRNSGGHIRGVPHLLSPLSILQNLGKT